MSYSSSLQSHENVDLTISGVLSSTATIDNSNGFPSIGVYISVPAGGEVSFQGSFDGVNFSGITLRSQAQDIYLKKTSTSGDFVGSISGFRLVRFIITVAGAGSGSISGRLVAYQSTLEGIEHGFQPDKRGFTPIRKDFLYTTVQTGTSVWTPASGKKPIITSYTLFASGTTDATVTLFDETDSTGNRLLIGFFDVTVNSPIALSSFMGDCPFVSSTANNRLRLTTTAAINIFGVFFGYEV